MVGSRKFFISDSTLQSIEDATFLETPGGSPWGTDDKRKSLVKATLLPQILSVVLMSYTSVNIHLVFRTKCSVPAIVPEYSRDLYNYIWGMCTRRNSTLLRINGMPDHLHVFVELNPKIALADFVRAVKASTSRWIKNSGKFPHFLGWADEYAAFSYSAKDKKTIISYIKNQQKHHARTSFADEMKALYAEFGLKADVDYFMRD